MTKAEIVNEVAKSTGIEKIAVQSVVEAFMETVKGSIIRKEPVYLRGFGSFIIKHRAKKAARNITKRTTMTIPAHDIPAFKPAKVFVNAVKEEKENPNIILNMPSGKKRKRHKMSTHKRKKRLRKNRHKKK